MRILSFLLPLGIFLLAIAVAICVSDTSDIFAPFPTTGAKDAPVKMVIFESIDCKSCDYFNENSYPFLKKHYIDEGKLEYTVVLLHTDDHSYQTLIACYCQHENFEEFLNAIRLKSQDLPANCNQEKSKELIRLSERLEDKYMPSYIETPYILINGKRINSLTLSGITTRIEQCINEP